MTNSNINLFLEESLRYKEVSFASLVKDTSGKDIIPINIENVMDKELLNIINLCAINYIKKFESDKILSGKIRINEIGNLMEKEFVEELTNYGIKSKLLREPGYPDFEIIDKYHRIIYVESKSSARKDCWTAPFRTFYYSKGKKIKENAIHILIGWELKKCNDDFKVVGFKIVDLSTINLRLKCEFSNNNYEIYKNTIIKYPHKD